MYPVLLPLPQLLIALFLFPDTTDGFANFANFSSQPAPAVASMHQSSAVKFGSFGAPLSSTAQPSQVQPAPADKYSALAELEGAFQAPTSVTTVNWDGTVRSVGSYAIADNSAGISAAGMTSWGTGLPSGTSFFAGVSGVSGGQTVVGSVPGYAATPVMYGVPSSVAIGASSSFSSMPGIEL